MGALVVLVGVQLSVLGLYFPPVFNPTTLLSIPPQTIISLPVQTDVAPDRPVGALMVLVAVQVSSTQPVGTEISGTLYSALSRFAVTRMRFSVEAAVPAANEVPGAGGTPATTVRLPLRRSANTGLARHSDRK